MTNEFYYKVQYTQKIIYQNKKFKNLDYCSILSNINFHKSNINSLIVMRPTHLSESINQSMKSNQIKHALFVLNISPQIFFFPTKSQLHIYIYIYNWWSWWLKIIKCPIYFLNYYFFPFAKAWSIIIILFYLIWDSEEKGKKHVEGGQGKDSMYFNLPGPVAQPQKLKRAPPLPARIHCTWP